MYHSLTIRELSTLQDMLFAATEEAYRVVYLKEGDPDWFVRYQPMHRELGHLFIEAGEELLARLNQMIKAA